MKEFSYLFSWVSGAFQTFVYNDFGGLVRKIFSLKKSVKKIRFPSDIFKHWNLKATIAFINQSYKTVSQEFNKRKKPN